jgi:hypothetical protein
VLGAGDAAEGFVGVAAGVAAVFSGDEVAVAGVALEVAGCDEGDEPGCAADCERSFAGDWFCFGGSFDASAPVSGFAGVLWLGWLCGCIAEGDWLAALCEVGDVEVWPS